MIFKISCKYNVKLILLTITTITNYNYYNGNRAMTETRHNIVKSKDNKTTKNSHGNRMIRRAPTIEYKHVTILQTQNNTIRQSHDTAIKPSEPENIR